MALSALPLIAEQTPSRVPARPSSAAEKTPEKFVVPGVDAAAEPKVRDGDTAAVDTPTTGETVATVVPVETTQAAVEEQAAGTPETVRSTLIESLIEIVRPASDKAAQAAAATAAANLAGKAAVPAGTAVDAIPVMPSATVVPGTGLEIGAKPDVVPAAAAAQAGPAVPAAQAAGLPQVAAAAAQAVRQQPGSRVPDAAVSSDGTSGIDADGEPLGVFKISPNGGAGDKSSVAGVEHAATAARGQQQPAAQAMASTANPQFMAQLLGQAGQPQTGAAADAADGLKPIQTADASTGTAGASFHAEMRAALDAPTQTAAYNARAAHVAQPAAVQIALQITRAVDQNADRMTVHLKPAELGKVTIELEVKPDNRIVAVIGVEKSETLDLLQRDARSLERALADAGLKTDSGSLEFNLQGNGNPAADSDDDGARTFNGALPSSGGDFGDNDRPVGAPVPWMVPDGRVDIHV